MCTSSISGVQRLPPYGERPARKVGQGTQRQSLQALVGLGKSWDVINYIRPHPTSACPGARDRAGHPFFCTTVDFDGEGNRYWATLLVLFIMGQALMDTAFSMLPITITIITLCLVIQWPLLLRGPTEPITFNLPTEQQCIQP